MQCDTVEKRNRKSRYFLFKEYFSLRNGSILKYQVFRDIGYSNANNPVSVQLECDAKSL